jgi:prepilin-type N-terminal cleavage/methylation domain-containing protein
MRGRLRQEDGFTLVELMMVMFMMTIVIVIFTSVFENVNVGVARQQERSRANDEARLAIEQLDREIRSGNVLYDPEDDDPQFYTFRIHSQANASTRISTTYADAFGATCVQWLINDDEELVRRFWKPGDPAVVSDWRVVAEHVVNRTLATPVPAFSLDDDPIRSSRTVVITLMVDADTTETVSRPVRIQTSLTGRNSTLGFSTSVCDPAPA